MKTLDIWKLFEGLGIFDKMRRKLKAREEKQKWNNDIGDIDLTSLIVHLRSEVKELELGISNEDLLNIQEECADIANCCCFIYSKIESFKGGK